MLTIVDGLLHEWFVKKRDESEFKYGLTFELSFDIFTNALQSRQQPCTSPEDHPQKSYQQYDIIPAPWLRVQRL